METTRLCGKCGQVKLLSAFYKKRGGRFGRSSTCSDCGKAYTNAWHHRNKAVANEKRRQWGAANGDRIHARHIRKRYGMDVDDFLALLERQEDCCLICLGLFDFVGYHKSDKSPVVDHDHVSGKVRGLICKKCNIALGCFRDSPQVVASALRYLRLRKEQPLGV